MAIYTTYGITTWPNVIATGSYRKYHQPTTGEWQNLPLKRKMPLTDRDQIDLYEKKSSRIKWWHAIFFFSGISVLACLCQLFLPYPYGLMMTSAEIAEVGIVPGCEDDLERCICPRETICAINTLSIILLALARCSAFFDYPLYMMMFLTKCHNINNFLRRTVLREWVDFADMHKVHKTFGIVVGIETMSHSFCHILRWGLNKDIHLLWGTATGLTGMLTAVATPLICWPMAIEYLKQRIKFEVRKGLHYLAVAWAAALLFHAPSRIYYLIGVPGAVYLMDYIFGYFARNMLIENVFFERYGENGVALHFENPLSWEAKPKTSYVYVMCPWISKYQWHAFTMFPEPQQENHTMLCIGTGGDWTKELHTKIKVPCYRSIYVIGPFKSEFSDTAVTTSNAIAVASGIGITPTLSLILNYVGKKRINVVWMCRDAGLIEYILHKVDIGAITKKSYVFIFYTGKRELALPRNLPVNIFIFKCRPHLEHIITGIIASIHSGDGLPEKMYDEMQKLADAPFHERMKVALSRVFETYDMQEMFDYAIEETVKEATMRANLDLESDCTSPTALLNDGVDKHEKAVSNLSDLVPEGKVSVKGLNAMILKFLGGIGDYSDSEMIELFQKIDKDGSGFIDKNKLEEFVILATWDKMSWQKEAKTKMQDEFYMQDSKTTSRGLKVALSKYEMNTIHSSCRFLAQSGRFKSVLGGEETMEYMKTIANNADPSFGNPLEDWGLFYCGGSNKIKTDLKKISRRYGLDLAVEKFDW